MGCIWHERSRESTVTRLNCSWHSDISGCKGLLDFICHRHNHYRLRFVNQPPSPSCAPHVLRLPLGQRHGKYPPGHGMRRNLGGAPVLLDKGALAPLKNIVKPELVVRWSLGSPFPPLYSDGGGRRRLCKVEKGLWAVAGIPLENPRPSDKGRTAFSTKEMLTHRPVSMGWTFVRHT